MIRDLRDAAVMNMPLDSYLTAFVPCHLLYFMFTPSQVPSYGKFETKHLNSLISVVYTVLTLTTVMFSAFD